MTTTVKLTNGKYLDGEPRKAVIGMCHNCKETTTYDGNTIYLVSHKKTDELLEIVVRVNNEI